MDTERGLSCEGESIRRLQPLTVTPEQEHEMGTE